MFVIPNVPRRQLSCVAQGMVIALVATAHVRACGSKAHTRGDGVADSYDGRPMTSTRPSCVTPSQVARPVLPGRTPCDGIDGAWVYVLPSLSQSCICKSMGG